MKNVCKTQVRDSIRDIAQILSKGFRADSEDRW